MTTDLERRPFDQLVDPATGMVATYDDPESCAQLLAEVALQSSRLFNMRRLLSDRLVDEARDRGATTFQTGQVEVSVEADYRLDWDEAPLYRLVEEGLITSERWAEFTKHEFVVDAREAAKIAKLSPAHNEIVEASRTRHITRQRAKVRRKATSAAAPIAPGSVQSQARVLVEAEREAAERGV